MKCHKQVMPDVDFSKVSLGKKRIGVNLAATITTMRDRLRLPFIAIQKYLKLFHKLDLSEGETDLPMAILCARVITYLQELFIFIRFPNIKSDNNPYLSF